MGQTEHFFDHDELQFKTISVNLNGLQFIIKQGFSWARCV
jgi:hypothetical protein